MTTCGIIKDVKQSLSDKAQARETIRFAKRQCFFMELSDMRYYKAHGISKDERNNMHIDYWRGVSAGITGLIQAHLHDLGVEVI